MRITSVTQGAAGATAWQPLNPKCDNFQVGFGVTLTGTVNLTYKVQHTFDDPGENLPVYITRSTTTATLTLTDHGLATTDTITVSGAGAPLDGTYAVAGVTDANVITYTVDNSGVSVSNAGATVSRMRVFDHPTVTSKTTLQDGNYAFPISAMRLNVTSYTSGKATLTIIQSGKG